MPPMGLDLSKFALWDEVFHPQSGPRRIVILYGTQTGTSEGFAKAVFASASARNYDVRISCMDRYDCSKLAEEDVIVCLTSTFYNGEFPDNARSFWAFVNSADRPADSLSKTSFAVFGLGNKKNVENFNSAGKMLDERLAALGSKRLVPIGLGDEYDQNGHESAYRPWVKSLWAALGSSEAKRHLPITMNCELSSDKSAPAAAAVPAGFASLKVVSNDLLSATGYDREERMLVLDLAGSPFASYELGSQILVQPRNSAQKVARTAAALKLDLDAVVSVSAVAGQHSQSEEMPIAASLTVRDLLSSYLDVSSAVSRTLLEGLSILAADKKEAEEMEKIATDMLPGNEYGRLMTTESFSLADVLERWRSVSITLSELVSNVPRVGPRHYSVASSPLVKPKSIEILYVLDTWATKKGPAFEGLCTRHMASLKAGDTVLAKIARGGIALPSDHGLPLVGVALGSGIGVFRGILEHRASLQAKGKKVGRVTLFYGCRHRTKDYLFEKDFQEWAKKGLADVVPSFSHDQAEFIHPGMKIAENPHKVADTLDANGVYVYCGIGGSVPGIVLDSLIAAVRSKKQLSDSQGAELLAKMRKEKRIVEEAYSRSIDAENALGSVQLRKGGHADAADESKPIAESCGDAKMFCFQCEQTAFGKGCTTVGICGKTPEVAALQDLLVHRVQVMSWYAHQLRKLAEEHKNLTAEETEIPAGNRYTLIGMFSTLTNVNFSAQRMLEYIAECRDFTTKYVAMYKAACKKAGVKERQCPAPVQTGAEADGDIEDAMVEKGRSVGVLSRFRATKNDALVGCQEMLVYGIKGVCAYADHAVMNKHESNKIYEFVHHGLSFLLEKESKDLNEVLGMLLKCGEANLVTMALLAQANGTYGEQTPAVVPVKPVPGKCILISGHELTDVEAILKQTEGTGINVYTHGEVLPAHGYPKLKAYKHLVGHFGQAWQRQSVEFGFFPGAIVMTTNCITAPREEYKDRIFTAGAVGWPGIPHIANQDFSAAIKRALELPGFSEKDTDFKYPSIASMPRVSQFTTGFGSKLVISLADKVIGGIKAGAITRFYVIGGCDGFEGERSYFTDFTKQLPETSVVLTVGCGKYRINHLDFKTIGDTGIPRLLDLGQCNDSYAAIEIALALAGALNCTVHDLPLSIVLSWFEQKAIAVLLTLLHLGLKNIRVGPNLPAFLRPSVVGVLSDMFGLKLVSDPTADLTDILGGAPKAGAPCVVNSPAA
eukprot:tig00000882_g5263.t1